MLSPKSGIILLRGSCPIKKPVNKKDSVLLYGKYFKNIFAQYVNS